METQHAPPFETAIVPEAKRPVVDHRPRCWKCGRTLFDFAARPWSKKCERCNAANYSEPDGAHFRPTNEPSV